MPPGASFTSPFLTVSGLNALNIPVGLTLIPGGTRGRPLAFSPPPAVALETNDREGVLRMLRYAGIEYRHPQSAAAAFGTDVFRSARDFIRGEDLEGVTFDWDHTLGNYKIFEDVPRLIRVRRSKTPPDEDLAGTPMTAIEIARPFLQEIALGMATGFALRQGLKRLDQWEYYVPQVGVATHTWPDRLGILGTYFVRLLPLLEGVLPGSGGVYERIADPAARSIIHLHHFLGYAESLIRQFDDGGFAALTPRERKEVMAYFEDGKAHYRKPLGALALRGWEISALLHFDDSTKVIGDLGDQGILVRQPHTRLFADVQEWHKIALPAVWQKREDAAMGIVENLARMEWERSPVAAVLGALNVYPDAAPPAEGLPEGVVLSVHETPTTLGEFWRYYVQPTDRLKKYIREVRARHGGLTAIRRAYREASERP